MSVFVTQRVHEVLRRELEGKATADAVGEERVNREVGRNRTHHEGDVDELLALGGRRREREVDPLALQSSVDPGNRVYREGSVPQLSDLILVVRDERIDHLGGRRGPAVGSRESDGKNPGQHLCAELRSEGIAGTDDRLVLAEELLGITHGLGGASHLGLELSDPVFAGVPQGRGGVVVIEERRLVTQEDRQEVEPEEFDPCVELDSTALGLDHGQSIKHVDGLRESHEFFQ